MFEFYVGGYAEPGQRGVLRCAFDGSAFEILDSNDELRNPSWLLHHPKMPLLYAVEELSPEGRLSVLSEADGHLKRVASVSTRGADPCHIAIAPDQGHLLVSNYTGGSLAVYALDREGLPTVMTEFIQHRMPAPAGGNALRQEAPHVHFALCDGTQVYVNDLGLNRVLIYGWDPARGRLIDVGSALEFPDGSGPRHLAFSEDGRMLYVLCELSATIHVFRREGQTNWRRVQVISTVPEDFNEHQAYDWSIAAAIHFIHPHALCASNRGHNSLSVFDAHGDGTLSLRQIMPSGGKTPRDFMTVDGYLLPANQDSGTIQVYKGTSQGYVRLETSLAAVHPTCLCRRADMI